MTKNQSYSHLIKDLIWAVQSPPLIVLPNEQLSPSCEWYSSEFYLDLYNTSSDWFAEVSRHPEKIQMLVDEQKDKRLGKLFETLWAAYLNDSERFEIVEQNLQIIENGKTLGELDLIVVDLKTNKMLHWELAVKFYLGMGDTSQWRNWYGPSRKDRLDLKMSHLLNHQTILCQHETTKKILKSKNIKIDNCAVIMKGCLFYPSIDGNNSEAGGTSDICKVPQYANEDHCRSRWAYLSKLNESASQSSRFYPLIGKGWMASLGVDEIDETYTAAEIKQRIDKGDYRLPLLLSVLEKGIEIEKIFIVNDEWHK